MEANLNGGHGGWGWFCPEPVYLEDMSDERQERPVTMGVYKGRTAVMGRCPHCDAVGRVTWLKILVKEVA